MIKKYEEEDLIKMNEGKHFKQQKREKMKQEWDLYMEQKMKCWNDCRNWRKEALGFDEDDSSLYTWVEMIEKEEAIVQ